MELVIDPETNLYLKEIMEKGEIRGIKKKYQETVYQEKTLSRRNS